MSFYYSYIIHYLQKYDFYIYHIFYSCVRRYGKHFKIEGNRSTHYGAFDCSATMAAQQYGEKSSDKSSCC